MYVYIYIFICVCMFVWVCVCVCQLSGRCTCPITAIHSYLLICLDLGVSFFYCWGCFFGSMLCECVSIALCIVSVRLLQLGLVILMYIFQIYICHIRSTYRVTLASHFCLLSPSACFFFVYVLIVYVRLIRFPIYLFSFSLFLFFFQLTSNYSYVSISLINSLNIRYLHGLSILNSHFSILTSLTFVRRNCQLLWSRTKSLCM